ncbi:Flp family type IVb pilin [Novosphingobium sp. MW5]|nr:Flp family type IVb pilin [Novosphingobium sp. MW5]
MTILQNILRCPKGATAIEYGLICAFISIAGITTLGSTGESINYVFNKIKTQVTASQ